MLNQSWVELHGSRGVESYHHKLFMRYSGMKQGYGYISMINLYTVTTPAVIIYAAIPVIPTYML